MLRALMFRMHHMLINRPVAKQIWTAVGSAAQDLENPPAPYEVAASDRGGKPLRATVGHREFSRFVSRDLVAFSILLIAVVRRYHPSI